MAEQFNRLKNHEWEVVRMWVILAFLFLVACFVPGLAGIDGMDGGFAIITLCGFMVVVCIVVLAFYIPRARRQDRMMKSGRYLAWWDISKPLWNEFVAYDFAADRMISKGTFTLISIVSLVVGIALSVWAQDILMLYICLGIIVMLIFPAFAFPWFRKRKKLRNPPLVVFSAESVYVGGSFFTWNMAGARLDSTEIEQIGSLTIMKMVMTYPTRTGMESWEIRLPVPPEKLDEAQKLLGKYNGL